METAELQRKWFAESEARHAISECDRPRPVSPTTIGDRVLSMSAQRSCRSLVTAAMERPRRAGKVRTACSLDGDLRFESFVESFSAYDRVRP